MPGRCGASCVSRACPRGTPPSTSSPARSTPCSRCPSAGSAAARLQADLAAAHSELEAERQGRAAQTGAFRAQLDEVRAAKEEACRDAVDWAEESSRFKGEVTALLTKCQKLEEDKAAAIESNASLEADLAAAIGAHDAKKLHAFLRREH